METVAQLAADRVLTDDVDRDAQQVFQLLAQSDFIEKRRFGSEADEQVDVRSRMFLTTCQGAHESRGAGVMASHRGQDLRSGRLQA